MKIFNIFNHQNRSCTLLVGSTQDRNSYADPNLSKTDWILARSSLIFLLGVKTQEGNNTVFFKYIIKVIYKWKWMNDWIIY